MNAPRGSTAKDVRRGVESVRAGDYDGAMEHFRKALNRNPNCMEAHNGLGYCHMHERDFKSALCSFRKALYLDPGQPVVQINVAAALLELGEAREAETAARQAIRLDPLSPSARFALGLALYWQKIFSAEAIDALGRAEDQFPNARIVRANIYLRTNRLDQAIAKVREYLASPNPAGRATIQAWLEKAEEVSIAEKRK